MIPCALMMVTCCSSYSVWWRRLIYYMCLLCQLQDHHPVHRQSVWTLPPRWERTEPKTHSGQQGPLLLLLHISVWTWVNRQTNVCLHRHHLWAEIVNSFFISFIVLKHMNTNIPNSRMKVSRRKDNHYYNNNFVDNSENCICVVCILTNNFSSFYDEARVRPK